MCAALKNTSSTVTGGPQHANRKAGICAACQSLCASLAHSSGSFFCYTSCYSLADQTANPWQVFSRERQFMDNTSQAARAGFETDRSIKVLPAEFEDMTEAATFDDQDEVDVAAVAPQMKEAQFFAGKSADALLVPGTKPPSAKAVDVIRWIKSQKEFIEDLKAVEKCHHILFPRMTAQHATFSSLSKLRRASEYFLEQLLMAQMKDPDLEWPLGMLLLDVIPVIAKPFVQVCTALDVKIDEMKAELQVENMQSTRFKTQVAHNVQMAAARLGTDEKISRIMQSAFMQVRSYTSRAARACAGSLAAGVRLRYVVCTRYVFGCVGHYPPRPRILYFYSPNPCVGM